MQSNVGKFHRELTNVKPTPSCEYLDEFFAPELFKESSIVCQEQSREWSVP